MARKDASHYRKRRDEYTYPPPEPAVRFTWLRTGDSGWVWLSAAIRNLELAYPWLSQKQIRRRLLSGAPMGTRQRTFRYLPEDQRPEDQRCSA